jgi:hypothetical protein
MLSWKWSYWLNSRSMACQDLLLTGTLHMNWEKNKRSHKQKYEYLMPFVLSAFPRIHIWWLFSPFSYNLQTNITYILLVIPLLICDKLFLIKNFDGLYKISNCESRKRDKEIKDRKKTEGDYYSTAQHKFAIICPYENACKVSVTCRSQLCAGSHMHNMNWNYVSLTAYCHV